MNCPHCHRPINIGSMLAVRSNEAQRADKKKLSERNRKVALNRWANFRKKQEKQ
jgi:hypothetical protein